MRPPRWNGNYRTTGWVRSSSSPADIADPGSPADVGDQADDTAEPLDDEPTTGSEAADPVNPRVRAGVRCPRR